MTDSDEWKVIFTGNARKQQKRLPAKIDAALKFLLNDLIHIGPEVKHWQNYGRLTGKKDYYHCHLNKGLPRYVAVWKVTDYTIKLMEIRYVGTHEKANYRRIN
ncbi:MAG: cytotoxic translational repressor of toxin-antitoxin stability system [Oxalobacter sp.]|nr:cytotoxic translational repressor of toxin-antitoxin stability system [Oxalobacter sp.]